MPNELKPCEKCKSMCHVHIVKTIANKYRVGCITHSVWQENGYDNLDEAVAAWNRRANDEQR